MMLQDYNKFKIPIDKVPKFDIELCNYTTRTFQLKAADATLVVPFRTVEDFIERFEFTFSFYSSNIDIHWEKALGQSFSTSIDESPKVWLPHELSANRDKYRC